MSIFYFCRLECTRVKRDISFHAIQHSLMHTHRLLLHHAHTYTSFRWETWRGIKILDLPRALKWQMASDDRHPPRKKALMQYHVIDLDECAAKERFGMSTPLYSNINGEQRWWTGKKCDRSSQQKRHKIIFFFNFISAWQIAILKNI